jgi:Lrp/AsnC family transcriptional regulator, leucine-responsive regulatory protein
MPKYIRDNGDYTEFDEGSLDARGKLEHDQRMELDSYDRNILRALQADARQTNQQLANNIALSPSACLERVRKLEKRGLIQGYRALLNARNLGMDHVVFVEVTLTRSTQDAFVHFARAVRAIPQIQACHMVAGGFDYLLKVRGRDIQEYRQFLGEVLTQLPDVQSTHTYVVMETVKDGDELNV